MKFKSLILSLALGAALLAGCSSNEETVPETNTNPPTTNNETNATSSPSRVTDEAKLIKAAKESWIVILENDVTTTKEITLEGGMKKEDSADSSKMVPASRVLAMYKTDSNQEKIASYTLTIPKLIVRDENAKIEGGTIKGDVYIESNSVKFEDVTIDGNVYFKTQEAKDTFNMDSTSKVTGAMEVK